jgi:hypothetical protein
VSGEGAGVQAASARVGVSLCLCLCLLLMPMMRREMTTTPRGSTSVVRCGCISLYSLRHHSTQDHPLGARTPVLHTTQCVPLTLLCPLLPSLTVTPAVVAVEVAASWAELGGATVLMMLAHMAASQPHLTTLPPKALDVSLSCRRGLCSQLAS